MSIDCNCPITDNIPAIGSQACGFNVRQVSGFALGVRGSVFTTGTLPATDIEDSTSWTARIALTPSDANAVQVVQQVSSFIIPANEVISIAGDTNDTPEGVEIVIDETAQKATFMIRDLLPATLTALREYYCVTKGKNLGVILFTSNQVVDNALDFIPITNFYASGLGLGGKTDTNNVNCQFSLDSGWYDTIVQRDVDFNPLSLTN